ncbi:hypothetical protein DL767_001925 [Monosporascus sp. MG133]|nr:hypothetical protein DL767_001925 [Monosporascus sp. MG133]
MITLHWALGAIIVASIASASTDELQLISRLLKRQEPGTPAYNCHDNCGQAILQARNSDDVCTDDVFLTNYQNCLQCSGPDNVDIWRYYGNSLTTAAEPCGRPTTPLSGEQPDVGPAIPAGSSASPTTTTSEQPTTSATSASESTMATTTEAPTTAAEDSPSETQESSTAAPTAEPTSTTTTTTSEASVSTSHEESTPSSTTVYATVSGIASTVVPTVSDGGNGTATATTSSGVVPVTGAANALVGLGPAGVYGALALGAWYAVA